jgi:xylulokinase
VTILGLDVGSSSVKAALLRGSRVIGKIAHARYAARYDGPRAEVDPHELLAALAQAIAALGPAARKVDVVALDVMSPAWVAMDSAGRALTPIVTHQDRRSVEEARLLERRVGKSRYLRLAGNLPVPGGISATTCAWFIRHEPRVMKRADLVGHLNTFLHRQMTGARVIDPSNASFTGLYRTLDPKGGWSAELTDAVGLRRGLLPQVIPANEIAGKILPQAARQFGLLAGTPMACGCVDTSAAMLLAGARRGRLLNVMGSTDVLALCTDKPIPNDRLLTRALGISGKPLWMSVGTIAAAGSSMNWGQRELFADQTGSAFWKLVDRLCRSPLKSSVRFDPYLAGERVGVEQRQASFTGLTLASTREDLLSAMIEALAEASAGRLPLLTKQPVKIDHRVMISGGGSVGPLRTVMHRDWPGRWSFFARDEATLRGLATMEFTQTAT